MKRVTPVKPPTRRELFTLRLMIILGLASMFFFIKGLLTPDIRGYSLLYWVLIITITFNCFRILIEWVHYFYITVPKTPPQEKIYTVDIFTTFCAGEPYEMIVETLTAIQAITYPHETYLCDEANDPYLIEICRQLGVNHVTRTVKVNAKAGNINNALSHAKGELCVVLDPDHVPFPDFLDPIVSHFNDPDIGFVQIVQAYSNHNEGLIAKGAAQQTFQFYGPIMMTMNKYGTVLAIGANCTFRRSALDSIGGHAAGLAEDMHTAMQLHAKGWKSVYVPAVLARGLVPTTLSAYYSQQLKWSRGVFDLFVTAYPKLFKKFTWRQKLHYALIPMHYVSGLIFLINFLIPVISLTFDRSPLNIDLANFAVLGLPLFIAIVLVRHFVQWWVMEDDERGFHVVGGLLMIGTWWVFVTGLFYTIIGKKVPYIPTPKDGTEENNWPLNIPNIVVVLISIAAIFYGLYNDWNPYTLIMAGFALMNCFILMFSVIASRQHHFRKLRGRYNIIDQTSVGIAEVKKMLWKLRRRIYTGLRSTALMLTVLITCTVLYVLKEKSKAALKEPDKQFVNHTFLSGIFAPQQADGVTSVKLLKQFEAKNKVKFNIVSLYVSWGDQPRCNVPVEVLDSVYKNNSVPMITWEPWQNLFNSNKNLKANDQEKKVFSRITSGYYDNYLERFSKQLAAINRPVYLRFAHEADNPFYPWSATGNNTPDEFKAAWRYVHNYFIKNRAYNVIWVWNPWKPNAVDDHFPGNNYVDWIGVTNLNYGTREGGRKWYSMEQLYTPFHNNPIFKSGLPVMLAEMGSLPSEGHQREWLTNGFKSIKNKFSEIKGFVLFNNGFDKNASNGTNLDWRITDPEVLAGLWREQKIANNTLQITNTITIANPYKAANLTALINNIKGINYAKGENWSKNYHVLTKREIINDFTQIKQMGFNTIKLSGPGVYDHNILEIADRLALKVNFSFWIPDSYCFDSTPKNYDQLLVKTVASVNDLKSNKSIVSWNISNSILQKMAAYYYKPELLYRQDAYIKSLKKLVTAIKAADPTRQVTLDVDAENDLLRAISLLHENIPEIDSYGLTFNENVPIDTAQLAHINALYFFSKVSTESYLKLSNYDGGFFIANWQDETTRDLVTFDGLKDKWGGNKIEFYQIYNRLKGWPEPKPLPSVKILLPAKTVFDNVLISYHAVIQKNGKWSVATNSNTRLKFKWELVKNDDYGNHLSAIPLGTGPYVIFKVPDSYSYYNLYLYVSNGKAVEIVKSKLNTPL
jgi:cellulose synthase/poly-beta-1,6-N-acetylglucosamine synthase-like glycosyltransferase